MPLIVGTMKEAQAALYIADANVCSLHEGDPGTTTYTDNEVSVSTSPAYVRQPIVWNSDGDGVYHSDAMTFSVTDVDLTNVVIWSTAGDPIDVGDIQDTVDGADTYTLVLTYNQE